MRLVNLESKRFLRSCHIKEDKMQENGITEKFEQWGKDFYHPMCSGINSVMTF